jgi:hypothetical protein
MQTIFKYPLKGAAVIQEIELYSGSQILSVIEQDRQVVVYVLTDPEEAERGDKRVFSFMVLGTGWNHPANNFDLTGYSFLGTVKDGGFVWHVFWK